MFAYQTLEICLSHNFLTQFHIIKLKYDGFEPSEFRDKTKNSVRNTTYFNQSSPSKIAEIKHL